MNKWDKHLVPPTDPILKRVCDPVARGEQIDATCDLMQRVCKRGSVLGAGLAAPQIGVAKRLIFINCPNQRGTIHGQFMLNPLIVERAQEEETDEEGCLSYPGIFKLVPRPVWIRVKYQTVQRAEREEQVHGYRARVICHEIDHLDGICRVGDPGLPDSRPRVRSSSPQVALAAIASLALAR
jgi:peptide deformylase